MQQRMTWDEIKVSFPNEWVALIDYERTGAIGVVGTIVSHHADKKLFHEALRPLMTQYGKIAVRYTGRLIKDAENTPLLWQISNTN